MSETERSEVRDPEIPAMVFGRPPTRPGSRDDEASDDRDDPGQEAGEVPGDAGDDVREAGEVPGDAGDDERGAGESGDDAGDGGARPGRRGDEPGDGPLLGAAADLRRRWDAVQVGFVDDPRGAVGAAAGMVSEAASALQAEIERRRAALAGFPDGEADRSTDALLAAFHDYRELFDRVVSA